jgi:hypothetical protein
LDTHDVFALAGGFDGDARAASIGVFGFEGESRIASIRCHGFACSKYWRCASTFVVAVFGCSVDAITGFSASEAVDEWAFADYWFGD